MKKFLTALLICSFTVTGGTIYADSQSSIKTKIKSTKKRALQKRQKAKEKRREAVTAKMKNRTDARKAKMAELKKKKAEALKSFTEKKKKRVAALRDKKITKKVDARQKKQGKRISHGIKKGFLTKNEIATLNSQQQKIANMEKNFKADKKITKEEARSLRETLHIASVNIWSDKHNTEGKQMAFKRVGNKVRIRKSVTDKFSGGITGSEAKAITSDFKTMMQYKKELSNGNLTDDARSSMQQKYDNLLNKYIEEYSE